MTYKELIERIQEEIKDTHRKHFPKVPDISQNSIVEAINFLKGVKYGNSYDCMSLWEVARLACSIEMENKDNPYAKYVSNCLYGAFDGKLGSKND